MECVWVAAAAAVLFLLVGPVVLSIVAYRASRANAERLAALSGALDRFSSRLARLERVGTPAAEPAAPPAAASAEMIPLTPVPAETVLDRPAVPAEAALPAPAPVPAAAAISFPAPEPAPAPAAEPPEPPPSLPSLPAPPRGPSLEERLGARLPVWIGSIALALAGAFLVKYSFEQGWISPPIRVALGVVFGVVMLAGGEWLRRSSDRVAQGLSAAGIADLFACFLAAVHLYHLISPAVGFGFMALTTAVAVALSLRQGVMVAVIGLIGGLLTPFWMRTGDANARNLFAYLLLLQVGLLAVSRKRGWWPIAASSLAGGLLWVLAWLGGGVFEPGDEIWLSLFLLASAASTVIAFLARPRAGEAGGGLAFPGLVWGAVAAALAATALVAHRSGYSTTEWAFVGLLAAGAIVLARLRPELEGLAWVAAAVPAVLLAAWGYGVEAPEVPRFLATAAALGALFAIGAYAALWGARSPGRWGALAAASALVYFLIAWASTTRETADFHWGMPALGLGIVALLAALPLARRRAERPEVTPALAALAVAVTSFVSLAVPLELDRQWIAVAWALEVAALVWLAGRFRLPQLVLLARLLGLAVLVRLVANPEVIEYPIGTTPLLNWLLYGYGVPLLAFAGAAVLARRQGEERLSAELQWGAVVLGFALATLEVRQLYHPGALATGRTTIAEWGTYAVVWTALGLALLVWTRNRPLPSLELAGRALVSLGLAATLVGPALAVNPLWNAQPVGETPVVNLLLWVYGLPALLAALAARELLRRPGALPLLPRVWGLLALALAFLMVTLEVRQAFHGALLDRGLTSTAERYAYSAAWVLFGTVLLVAGIARRGRVLRWCSLAVMLLAVGKTFLYDTANLSDLYRVFSFLGLGASLLLLAYLYQRFVFREEKG